MAAHSEHDAPVQAGLLRRLLAALYDGLILLALWLLAGAVWIGLRHGEPVPAGSLPFQLYLLAVPMAFFCGFWSGYGRTLGMQAWRLQVVDATGRRPSPGRAVLRFFGAVAAWLPAGLGVLWMLVDPQRLTVQDRLSGTRIVVVPKERKD